MTTLTHAIESQENQKQGDETTNGSTSPTLEPFSPTEKVINLHDDTSIQSHASSSFDNNNQEENIAFVVHNDAYLLDPHPPSPTDASTSIQPIETPPKPPNPELLQGVVGMIAPNLLTNQPHLLLPKPPML